MDSVHLSNHLPYVTDIVNVNAAACSLSQAKRCASSLLDQCQLKLREVEAKLGPRQDQELFSTQNLLSEDGGRSRIIGIKKEWLDPGAAENRRDDFVLLPNKRTRLPDDKPPPLHTFRCRLEHDAKVVLPRSLYRQVCSGIRKYRHSDFSEKGMKTAEAVAEEDDIREEVDGDNDVLVRVVVAKPYNKKPDPHKMRLGRLLSFDLSLDVLGSQLLSELAAHIPCNVSQRVDRQPEQNQAHFFYIENEFYGEGGNDNMASELITPILSWSDARMGPSSLGMGEMRGVRVRDLCLRLGQLYLYRHSIDCDHLLAFTNIRSVHERVDSLCVREYPAKTSLLRPTVPCMCVMCNDALADYVTFNHEWTEEQVSFWCCRCLQLSVATGDGRLQCETYEYTDRMLCLCAA